MINYRVRVKYFLKKTEEQKRRKSKEEWLTIEAIPDSVYGDGSWRYIVMAMVRVALVHFLLALWHLKLLALLVHQKPMNLLL